MLGRWEWCDYLNGPRYLSAIAAARVDEYRAREAAYWQNQAARLAAAGVLGIDPTRPVVSKTVWGWTTDERTAEESLTARMIESHRAQVDAEAREFEAFWT